MKLTFVWLDQAARGQNVQQDDVQQPVIVNVEATRSDKEILEKNTGDVQSVDSFSKASTPIGRQDANSKAIQTLACFTASRSF